jgi:hypothetical protein
MADIWSKTLWIYGLAIVVSLLIAVVIKIIVLVLGRADRKPANATAVAAAPPVPAFGVPADHLVVIAAAAYAMLGGHRIVHIEETRHRAGWLAEGRQAHHASHGVEHHPKY